MSKLLLTGHGGARFSLNVTQFRSPMSASISSVQTRKMEHHFPIRAGQPDIQFTVQFNSIRAKHEFQDFVRDHQRNTWNKTTDYSVTGAPGGCVTLSWPERNIDNWTGYILSMPIKEARFEYAPKVTFGVSLIESMMTKRTWQISLGNGFEAVQGPQIPAYVPTDDGTSHFKLPTSNGSAEVKQAVSTVQSIAQSIINGVQGFFG